MSDAPKNMFQVDTDKLPFAETKQRALVGHALKNDEVFSKTIRTVDPEWFHDGVMGRIWKNMKEHFRVYKIKPSIVEVKECPDFMSMQQGERQKHTGMVDVAINDSLSVATKVLLTELTVWYRARVLQIGVPLAADLYNRHEIEAAAVKLKETMKEFQSAGNIDEIQAKFGNVAEEFTAIQTNKDNAMTIGNPYFDHILDAKCPTPEKAEPGKQYGSLHRGELSVVLAPTSAGKSTLLTTATIANVMRQKRILYVTHEDPKVSVKMNMRKAFSGKDETELFNIFNSPNGLHVLNAYDAVLAKHIVYLPLNRVGLSVEEVMDIIQQFQEREIMEYGKGFDMIVDDYPSRLTLGRGQKWEKRQVLEEIYQQFAQLGLDLNCHVMTAMQVNREGNKINKRMGNHERATRLVTLEDASEAFGPMTAARVVITINRTPWDVSNNQVTMLCCKTKQGPADWAITLDCDYGKSLSFKKDSRCFWYRGDVSLAKFSQEILTQHAAGGGGAAQIEDQQVIRYLNMLQSGEPAY